MKYYVIAPASIESGGPELAHQMCMELNNLKEEAYMYYVRTDRFQVEPVDINASPKYGKYRTKHVSSNVKIDVDTAVVLFNEGSTVYIPYIKAKRKVLWWMSVDNYKMCTAELDLDIIRKEVSLHLVQSYYAYLYVRDSIGIPEEKILYVSDYIAEKYFMRIDAAIPRMDIALYNPKKGLDKVLPIIEQTPWLKWIPLINLTEEDMIAYMHLAKVYVDFGNHPGKDRIPREAAICGCCVITNREGRAAYWQDVPIPEEYKFSNIEHQCMKVVELIKDICLNHDKHIDNFKEYRAYIGEERERFTRDVKKMIINMKNIEYEN